MNIDNKFRVYWKHDLENKTTLCFIEDNNKNELSQGKATAYALDNYNKVVGRKVSLDRAIYGNDDFNPTREERTVIWEGVLNRAHLIPSKKVNERNERRIINNVLNDLYNEGFLAEEDITHEEISNI